MELLELHAKNRTQLNSPPSLSVRWLIWFWDLIFSCPPLRLHRVYLHFFLPHLQSSLPTFKIKQRRMYKAYIKIRTAEYCIIFRRANAIAETHSPFSSSKLQWQQMSSERRICIEAAAAFHRVPRWMNVVGQSYSLELRLPLFPPKEKLVWGENQMAWVGPLFSLTSTTGGWHRNNTENSTDW